MKRISLIHYFLFFSILVFTACSNEDEDEDNPGGGTGGSGEANKALVLSEGSQSIETGGSISMKAQFVDVDGNVSDASSVKWESSNSSTAQVSGGTIAALQPGTTTITATVEEDGNTYTAKASFSVIQKNAAYQVLPGAITWEEGVPHDFFFTGVYLGQGTASFSYKSNDESVVKVNGNRLEIVGAGETTITATISANGNTYTQEIPVLILGKIQAPLPVTRIEISPGTHEMFPGDNKTFEAKAYNSADEEVSDVNFSWSVGNDTIGSITQAGVFTAQDLGKTSVKVTAQGISAQAEVFVYPDSMVYITPIFKEIDPGGNHQFSAKVYTVDKTDTTYAEISNQPTITWLIPEFDFPDMGIDQSLLDALFNFATVDASGKVTVKSNALAGNVTSLNAYVKGRPGIAAGGAAVMVGTGIGGGGGGNTPCGTGSATDITLSPSGPINLNLFSNSSATLSASPVGDNSATVKFSSSDQTVATVDEDTGDITATGAGTATITVCSGNITKTVTVNVTM